MESHLIPVTITVTKPSMAMNWCMKNVQDSVGYAHAHEHQVGKYTLTVGFLNEDAAAKFRLFWGLENEQ